MIFKNKDSITDQLMELEMAVRNAAPGRERQRLEKELAQRQAGQKGEQEAGYHIDFHLKDRPNWAVIHDLRIEWNGRVAQVDHLLISRLLEIYVVETKSFRKKVRYANGGWERLNFNHWEGIPCPVEQNARHIAVLTDLITELRLAPSRLGVVMSPRFHNIVVVQPSCSVLMGDFKSEARIYRMDKLVKEIRNQDPAMLDIFKIISPETLYLFATKLAAYHKPMPGAEVKAPSREVAPPVIPQVAPAQAMQCQGCGGALSSPEANYCNKNRTRFGNHLLCRKCQRSAPRQTEVPVLELRESAAPFQDQRLPWCVKCGSVVQQKVVDYCEAHSQRFGGRVLCRKCQVEAKNVLT